MDIWPLGCAVSCTSGMNLAYVMLLAAVSHPPASGVTQLDGCGLPLPSQANSRLTEKWVPLQTWCSCSSWCADCAAQLCEGSGTWLLASGKPPAPILIEYLYGGQTGTSHQNRRSALEIKCSSFPKREWTDFADAPTGWQTEWCRTASLSWLYTCRSLFLVHHSFLSFTDTLVHPVWHPVSPLRNTLLTWLLYTFFLTFSTGSA